MQLFPHGKSTENDFFWAGAFVAVYIINQGVHIVAEFNPHWDIFQNFV